MGPRGARSHVVLLLAIVLVACAAGVADRVLAPTVDAAAPSATTFDSSEGVGHAVLAHREGLVSGEREATAKRRAVDGEAEPPSVPASVRLVLLVSLLLTAAAVPVLRAHGGLQRRGPPALSF